MKEFEMICTGLAILHSKSIIHRDLKPENIMVFKNKPEYIKVFNNSTLKIGDLGISKFDAGKKSRPQGVTRKYDTTLLFSSYE